MANKGTIMLGPWGGTGGDAWDYNPGSDSSIIEIEISHGNVVNSVAFTSVITATGQTASSGRQGGSGRVSDKISINGSGEYLSLISGTTLDYQGIFLVESLTFHTNLTTYGPFGRTTGSVFEIPMKNGEIVGFFGRAGDFVDALGIHVTPSTH